ncbi:MAG: SsrA-binding protein SmpB [Myxococcota bacterium]
MSNTDVIKSLVVNRKAKHEYTLTDRFEAGMVLTGSEVKSLRTDGSANLMDAYVELRDDGAWLLSFYIAPYDHANRENHEPRRARQLLLHKQEISKLRKVTRERGMTVIPTHVYFKGSRVKVEIAVAQGKKLHDKRHAIKERDIEKQLRRIR